MTAVRLTAGAMVAALVLTSWASPPLDTMFSILTLVAAAAFLIAWMCAPEEQPDQTVVQLHGAADDRQHR